MASRFSHIFLSIIIFLLVSPFANAVNTQPKFGAEMLIKGFNLSPKEPVNIVNNSSMMTASVPRIVEKRFMFPNIVNNGPSIEDLGHHAGYYKLPHSKGGRLFYFFFESRNNTDDPVVIWLNGGPGCSSSTGLFYENGPFQITKNLSLIWNNYGWDKVSNILYIDQPIGTGFSYSSYKSDLRHDEEHISDDLYDFIQEFFVGHPKFVKNDFYITGESYAGHYIPAFASRIQKGNKAKEGIHINLKGIAIGNGLTNPAIQYEAYLDFALSNKLIGKSDYDEIKTKVPRCEKTIKACERGDDYSCQKSFFLCTDIFHEILHAAGDDINYYDIRKKCWDQGMCYDFSDMEKFMNLESVRKVLGVGDIPFVACSEVVYENMEVDWMKNLEIGIPALLEDGVKVLIYAGEKDFICNWLGNSWWVKNMTWTGQKEFLAAKTIDFVVDGAEAGSLTSYGPLAFLKVYNAGHLVPMDQPKVSLQMIKKWMQGALAWQPLQIQSPSLN